MIIEKLFLMADPDQPLASIEIWKNLVACLSRSIQAAKNGEEPFILSVPDSPCTEDTSVTSSAWAMQMRIVYELDAPAQIFIPKEIQLLHGDAFIRFPLPDDIRDETLAAAFVLILACQLDQTRLFSIRNGKLVCGNEPLLSLSLQITDTKDENGEKEKMSVSDPRKEKAVCQTRMEALKSEDRRLNERLCEMRKKAFEQFKAKEKIPVYSRQISSRIHLAMAKNPEYSKALYEQAELISKLKEASRDYHSARLAESRTYDAMLRCLIFAIRHALLHQSHFDLLVQHLLRPVMDIECLFRFIDTCSARFSLPNDIEERTAWLLAKFFIRECSAKSTPQEKILCFTDGLRDLYINDLRGIHECAPETDEEALEQIAPKKRMSALQSLGECLHELMVFSLEFNVQSKHTFWVLQSIQWLLQAQNADPSLGLRLLGTAAVCSNSVKFEDDICQMMLDPQSVFSVRRSIPRSSDLDPAVLPWLALSLCGRMRDFKNNEDTLYAILDMLETLSDPEMMETPVESWKTNAYMQFFNQVISFFMQTEETRLMYEALECLIAIQSWIQKRVLLYGWQTIDEVRLFIRCISCRNQIRVRSSDAAMLEKWIFSPSSLSASSSFPVLAERECLYAIATSILIKEASGTSITFEDDLYEQFSQTAFRLLAAEFKPHPRMEYVDWLCSLTSFTPSILQDDMTQEPAEDIHLGLGTVSMQRNIADLFEQHEPACPDAGYLSAMRFILNLLFAFQRASSSDAQTSLRVFEKSASQFADRKKSLPEHILASRIACTLMNATFSDTYVFSEKISCNEADTPPSHTLTSIAKLIGTLLEKMENDLSTEQIKPTD